MLNETFPAIFKHRENWIWLQATLHPNGDIVFVYVFVPDLLTTDALYDHEPVAGLSDAFLIGDSELHVYHTMNVDNTDISTGTVIIFKAKPTCIRQTSCDDCANLRANSEFACSWCPSVHRCSDGADRLREHWDQNSCHIKNVSTSAQCAGVKDSASNIEWRHSMVTNGGDSEEFSASNNVSTVVSAVISTFLVLILLGVASGFVYLYGRNNPGGLAERLASRLEAPYKRFGIVEDSQEQVNNNNNSVEMGSKPMENNNTDSSMTFWENKDSFREIRKLFNAKNGMWLTQPFAAPDNFFICCLVRVSCFLFDTKTETVTQYRMQN